MAKRVAQNIQIEGLDELLHTLGDVLPKEARNLARQTVHAIAGKVRDEIRRTAPVDTGVLKKSIVAVRRRGTPTEVRSDVIATHGQGQKYSAFYWHFVEFGTQEQSAQPFITPVVEQTQPEIPDLYREQFGKKLERLMVRKAKKQ